MTHEAETLPQEIKITFYMCGQMFVIYEQHNDSDRLYGRIECLRVGADSVTWEATGE